MNRKQVSDRPITWRRATIAVLLGCWMLTGVSAAQEKPAGETEDTKQSSSGSVNPLKAQIKVFRLANSQAPAIAKVLADVFNDVHISIGIDDRSNSLVIKALPHTLESVGSVVSHLDRAEIKQAKKSNSAPPTEVEIRLVWLVSGLTRDDAPEPSADLKEVVDALAAKGIYNLRQVGQTFVKTIPNSRFTVQSSPILDQRRAVLHVSGNVVVAKPAAQGGPGWFSWSRPANPTDPNVPASRKKGPQRMRKAGMGDVERTRGRGDVGRRERTILDFSYGNQTTPYATSTPVSAGPQLYITLSATEAASSVKSTDDNDSTVKPTGGPAQLFELKTQITAPYGHYVVLGSASIDKTTSVFVVQVTRSD